MTYKKTQDFDKDFQEIATFARILSHPARIAILSYLAKTNSCISGDITNEIPLSRTTVSQHLQELKKAELIKGEIDGVKICYCINEENLKRCTDSFSKLFKKISKTKCC